LVVFLLLAAVHYPRAERFLHPGITLFLLVVVEFLVGWLQAVVKVAELEVAELMAQLVELLCSTIFLQWVEVGELVLPTMQVELAELVAPMEVPLFMSLECKAMAALVVAS
jgi:hypothetical protein